jgi:predicted enzyme related to lactoylglutathione lyase
MEWAGAACSMSQKRYGQVLGWTARDMPMGDDAYTVFEAAGMGVSGAMPLSEVHRSRQTQ